MQVSKKEERIEGLPHFDLIINYTAKTRRFSIPLPPFMAGPLAVKEVTGDTQVEVEKKFKEAVELIKQVDRKVNKVIIYDIEFRDTENFIEVKFQAAVANETKSKVGTRETLSYETLPSALLSDFPGHTGYKYPTVPYSLEVESWFAGIRKSLRDVQAQLLANGEVAGDSWRSEKKFIFGAGKQAAGPSV